jgi:hypothetical protein
MVDYFEYRHIQELKQNLAYKEWTTVQEEIYKLQTLAATKYNLWMSYKRGLNNFFIEPIYPYFKNIDITKICLNYLPFGFCDYHDICSTKRCMKCDLADQSLKELEVTLENNLILKKYKYNDDFCICWAPHRSYSSDDIFLDELRRCFPGNFHLDLPLNICYHTYWDQHLTKYSNNGYLMIKQSLFNDLAGTPPKFRIFHHHFEIFNPRTQAYECSI